MCNFYECDPTKTRGINLRKLFVILLILLFFATVSFAGNVDTYGIGAKATALGGAFSAYADDPFAVHHNPAGLMQIKKPTISGGVHVLDPAISISNYKVNGNASDFSDTSETLFVPHFGFAYPLSNELVLAVAAYAPYGFDIEWGKENPNASNWFHAYCNRQVITPSVAYQFNKKLSVGFGISIGKSEVGAKKLMPIGHNQYLELEVDLDDDFNYSFNFGAMYKPIKTVSLGIAYRSKTSVDYKGSAEVKGMSSSDVSMDTVDYPDQAQFGIRYQPHEKLSIEFDFVWTNWSAVETQIMNFSEIPNQEFDRNWDNTNQFKIGVEWIATDMLAFRAGYFYDPSPVPDSTFDFMWPDADKNVYSLGMGLDFGKFSVDSVFQYSLVEHDREIGGESSNLNNSYNGDSVSLSGDGHILGYGITLNYRF